MRGPTCLRERAEAQTMLRGNRLREPSWLVSSSMWSMVKRSWIWSRPLTGSRTTCWCVRRAAWDTTYGYCGSP